MPSCTTYLEQLKPFEARIKAIAYLLEHGYIPENLSASAQSLTQLFYQTKRDLKKQIRVFDQLQELNIACHDIFRDKHNILYVDSCSARFQDKRNLLMLENTYLEKEEVEQLKQVIQNFNQELQNKKVAPPVNEIRDQLNRFTKKFTSQVPKAGCDAQILQQASDSDFSRTLIIAGTFCLASLVAMIITSYAYPLLCVAFGIVLIASGFGVIYGNQKSSEHSFAYHDALRSHKCAQELYNQTNGDGADAPSPMLKMAPV